jgi:hypothetical protein
MLYHYKHKGGSLMLDRFGNDVLAHVSISPFFQWVNQQVYPLKATVVDDVAIVNAALNSHPITLQGWGTGIPDAYAGRDAALRLYSLATYANYHSAAEVFHDMYAVIDENLCSR